MESVKVENEDLLEMKLMGSIYLTASELQGTCQKHILIISNDKVFKTHYVADLRRAGFTVLTSLPEGMTIVDMHK